MHTTFFIKKIITSLDRYQDTILFPRAVVSCAREIKTMSSLLLADGGTRSYRTIVKLRRQKNFTFNNTHVCDIYIYIYFSFVLSDLCPGSSWIYTG